MGQVVGELLPLALGVAVSPVPVIAVILMLLAPRAGAASAGFAVGWVLGVVLTTTVVLLVASTADLGSTSEPSTGGSWLKLVLGLLLLAVGVRQWAGRPRSGEAPTLPGWMAAIDRMTPGRATGLGFVLAALNPKNLTLAVAAGATVAAGDLPGREAVATLVVFVVLATSTVVVPVVGYAVASDRVRPHLDALRAWLEQHNAAIMGVLLLVLGTVLLGRGLGGLL